MTLYSLTSSFKSSLTAATTTTDSGRLHHTNSSINPYFLSSETFSITNNDSSTNQSHQPSPTLLINRTDKSLKIVSTTRSRLLLEQQRQANYYTLAGRNQQNSRQFAKKQQIGTFLTQYKIRENYKFLQMISVPPLDPAMPKPEGGTSVPACGEPLLVPASFPQSIEAAIHKFANSSSNSIFNSPLFVLLRSIYKAVLEM